MCKIIEGFSFGESAAKMLFVRPICMKDEKIQSIEINNEYHPSESKIQYFFSQCDGSNKSLKRSCRTKYKLQKHKKRYFVCMCYVHILHVFDVEWIRIACIFFLPMNLNYAVCNNLICFFLHLSSFIIFFSFRCCSSLNSLTDNVVAHFRNSTAITKWSMLFESTIEYQHLSINTKKKNIPNEQRNISKTIGYFSI